MSQAHYDVAIVGGGLAGASLAYALSSLPINIALIDRVAPITQVQANYDARSVALSHHSCEIYRHLGLLPAIQRVAAAIDVVHVSELGRFGFTRITAAQQGLSALGYVIEIPQLLLILSEALSSTQNVTRITPATLQQLQREDQRWHLQLEGADPIAADFLVAADGTFSPVRKFLSLGTKEVDYQQWAIVANVTLNRDHQHVAYERFTPNGPLALLPLRPKQMTLVCTIPQDQGDFFKQLPDEDFLHYLRQWFGYRVGRFQHIGQRTLFPLRLIQAKEPCKPGVILLGNAAQNLHPIAAQGFNLGLRDVGFVAETMAQQLKQQKPLSDPQWVEDYWQLRRGDQQKTVRFSHSLLQLFSRQAPPIVGLRNLGMVGLDILPKAKQLFAKYGMGAGGRSSRLARGVPLDE